VRNQHEVVGVRLVSRLRVALGLIGEHVGAVLDGQDALAVDFHFDLGFIAERQPEFIDFLVLADKVGVVDPERRFLGGMAFNFCDGKILAVDPNFPFKEILVLRFGATSSTKQW